MFDEEGADAPVVQPVGHGDRHLGRLGVVDGLVLGQADHPALRLGEQRPVAGRAAPRPGRRPGRRSGDWLRRTAAGGAPVTSPRRALAAGRGHRAARTVCTRWCRPRAGRARWGGHARRPSSRASSKPLDPSSIQRCAAPPQGLVGCAAWAGRPLCRGPVHGGGWTPWNPVRMEGRTAMTEPIVVGVDASAPSRAAAEWAAGDARLRGLPLRVVHIDGADPAGGSPRRCSRWPRGPGAPFSGCAARTVSRTGRGFRGP